MSDIEVIKNTLYWEGVKIAQANWLTRVKFKIIRYTIVDVYEKADLIYA